MAPGKRRRQGAGIQGPTTVLVTIKPSAEAGKPAQDAGSASKPLPMWMS